MARKRKPKHPENYTTPEKAAQMLEQQARQLRRHVADHLVSLDLTIRLWYADEGAPVPEVSPGD